jgi:hypothetical protein
VLSGESVNDTALALAPQPLIVRVHGPDGEPLAGTVVQARGLPHDTLPSRLSMTVGTAFSEEHGYADAVTATSDANGYAQFGVRLGPVAGNARVEVRAISPEASGLPRDTASFTVRPGLPGQLVVAPRDTMIFVGAVVQSRVRVADQNGNAVANPPAITYEASAAQVTVSSNGAVTGAAFGRAWVRVRAIGVLDSLAVSVIPSGTIAARNTSFGPPLGGRGAVISLKLDVTDVQPLVPSGGGSGDLIPDWDPTGARIVIDAGPSGQRLYTYTPGGTAQQVMTAPNGLTEEFRPQYSSDGWIYFVGRAGSIAIYRVRPDGTSLARVSNATPPGQETHPSPSPDGTRVVVMSTATSGCSCAGMSFALWMLDVATNVSSSLNVGGHWPRWSPAGDLIAFEGPDNTLAVIRPDGTGYRVISGENMRYHGPMDWSPDGRWIIAVSSSFPSGLHLVEVATGLTLPLPNTGGLFHPAWRP